MANEEIAALRQNFELLKGAEQHKNALVEVRAVPCWPFNRVTILTA
jgi:hypothetical protein